MRPLGPLLCGIAVFGLLSSTLSAASPRPGGKSTEKAKGGAQDHKVKPGETLWSISKRYGTSVGEIMDFNKMPSDRLKDGMMLKIPPKVAEDPRRVRQHIHVVDEEETFAGIAEEYGVTAEALARANPTVDRGRLKVDAELVIPPRGASDPPPGKKTAMPTVVPASASPPRTVAPAAPAPAPALPQGSTTHTIAEGDTFYGLARKYGVTPEAIQTANPKVDSRRMKNGIQVIIPGKSPAAVAATPKRVTPSPAPSPPSAPPSLTVKAPAPPPTAAPKPTPPSGPVTLKPATPAAVILKPPGARQEVASATASTRPKSVSTDQPPAGIGPAMIPAPPAPRPSAPPSGPTTATPAPAGPATSSLPAPAPSPKATPNTVGRDGVIRSYIVSAGETEDTICEAFGITKDKLFEYNRMPASTRLQPGDEIMIPRVANIPGQ